jgi:uncharacterized protein involved in response to NO
MSSFPACQHAKPKSVVVGGLEWLAAEPVRVFFVSGVVWSVIGVLLWPLFYGGWLGFFPNVVHARLMVEAFGGAFVVGFLGTAGPRMAAAPKLTALELLGLFLLHQLSALSHLGLRHSWGDGLFAVMLGGLLLALGVRAVRFRKESPPPQLLLAFCGLGCGLVGAAMFAVPTLMGSPESYRLAGLLLYQGLLLPPTLGIGSFLFPRILGGEFGEPKSAGAIRQKRNRALAAAVLLVLSFGLEAYGWPTAGYLLRAGVAVAYLLLEVRWRRTAEAVRGTLSKGLLWALGSGLLGLLLAALFPVQRVSVEHFLYAGGFGLLMLVVGSRVVFGHSGELAGFEQPKSWPARWLVFLAILAAATRATTGFLPQLTVSHHIYAALTWAGAGLLWLVWHRRRFFKGDDK